jgi:hypothetical protein
VKFNGNPLISDRFGCKYGAVVAPIVAWKYGTNVLLGTTFWGTNIALYIIIMKSRSDLNLDVLGGIDVADGRLGVAIEKIHGVQVRGVLN